MSEATGTQRLPNRDEFTAFWQKQDTFSFLQLAPLGIYLGGLALFAFGVRLIDTTGRFALPTLAAANAWVFLLPIFYLRIYWKRHDRFIRCPQCRDWVAMDSSGEWKGPNPKWIAVSQTGHCGRCGAQMITLEQQSSPCSR